MAVVAAQNLSSVGVTINYSAADAAGDKFPNNGHNEIRVKNGSASQITVTLNSQKKCDQGFDHDIEIIIAAGEEKALGKLDPTRFNNADGQVEIGYSAVDAVTVANVQT